MGKTFEENKLFWGYVEMNDGTVLALTENAVPENYGTNGLVRYYCPAESEDGRKFMVAWDTCEQWNLSEELAQLEQDASWRELDADEKERMAELEEMGVDSSWLDDEQNACDWEDPVEIEEI